MCVNNQKYINFMTFSDTKHHLAFLSLDKTNTRYNSKDQLKILIAFVTFVLSPLIKEIHLNCMNI